MIVRTVMPKSLAAGFAVGILLATWVLPAAAQEVPVSAAARTALAVTVYNGDLALVRDSRAFDAPMGLSQLAFIDVSRRMQPESAILQSAGGSFRVVEQVFDFDVVSRDSLLRAYEGKEVRIVTVDPQTGRKDSEKATILSVDNGVVLELDGRITTEIPGRIEFDSLPSGLRTKSTLLALVDAPAAANDTANLSYLTNGLTWRADYAAELNADGTALDLSVWATVTNSTGADFPDAVVKLVAGDINRAPPAAQMRPVMEMAARSAVMADSVSQESLAAFHLYSIDRPVNLTDQQVKQLALLSAKSIAVRTDLVSAGETFALRGSMNGQVRTGQATRALVFDNTTDQGLGTPLPAGTVRVYGQDSSGALQLLGEDGLSHTPVGEEVRFTLGRDFDITVERAQDEFLRASDRITISAHTLTVRNAKDEPVDVRLVENMQGDWEILDENQPHTALPGQAQWTVEVPAGEEAQVTYRVRVRF